MTKGILGKKVGMTQIFTESGELIPVTVVEATPNVVLQVKTMETDGYEAIQVGYQDMREVLSNKPAKGHVAKANTAPKRFIREFKNVELGEYEVGKEITVDVFQAGDIIDVTGTTKGKGFQGVIKRHGQSRGPMAHGSRYHRRPGSMGPVAPNRVFKNKRLAGRMGGNRVTIQNLEVVRVDAERNVILIKGNVPGAKKSLITRLPPIRPARRLFLNTRLGATGPIDPGSQNGEITLNEEIFGIEPNESVVYDAIVMQRASLRQGTHAVKNRSAVRGGGRKPWRQKGTGRARQGSIRSPQWRGGGVVFGPTPRSYSYKLPKKVRRLAMKSVLSEKVAENNLVAIEGLNFDAPKTKEFKQVLANLSIDSKVLVVLEKGNDFAALSARNLPNVSVVTSDNVSVLDVVSNTKVLATQTALTQIEEVLA